MTVHPNEALVRRFYGAFSTGDVAVMTELTVDDVVFSVPGDSLTAGEHKGREAMFALFGLVGELTGGKISVEPVSIKAVGDDRVIATHRLRAERGDRSLDLYETEDITIENGTIRGFEESTSDQAVSDAFWS